MQQYLCKLILLASLSIFFLHKINAISGEGLFIDTVLHEIKLEFTQPFFWDSMSAHHDTLFAKLHDGEIPDRKYVLANITIDGQTIDSVGVRIKGYSSGKKAYGKKRSLKIDFNEFVSGKKYDGLKKLNLSNAYKDPGYMHDMLAYNMFRFQGISAPRTSYAKVYINNEYWGLYVVIEQVDDVFLSENFSDGSGNLFKAFEFTTLKYKGSEKRFYNSSYELKTNRKEDNWEDFIDFLRLLNGINVHVEDYVYGMKTSFNLEKYLTILAIDLMIFNWDNYLRSGRNYYLYHNPMEDQFYWIPWDYNSTFDPKMEGDIDPQEEFKDKPLVNNIFRIDEFVDLYLSICDSILAHNFTEERLFKIIDETDLLICEAVYADGNKLYRDEDYESSLGYSEYTAKEQRVNEITTTSGVTQLDTSYVRREFTGIKKTISERIPSVRSQLDNWVTLENNPFKEKFVKIEENYLGTRDAYVFPNPGRNMVNIGGIDESSFFGIRIFDLSGKLIQQWHDKSIIDITEFSPGIYFVEIEQNNRLFRSKFLKM